jgi:hypothetical protein
MLQPPEAISFVKPSDSHFSFVFPGEKTWGPLFVETMKDDEAVIQAIRFSESDAPADMAFMKQRKKTISFTQFEQLFAKKTFKKEMDEEEPIEELEFVNFKKGCGWPEHAAQAEWKKMLKSCPVADHEGYMGGVRLWFCKKSKRQTGTELFHQSAEKSGSDQVKNPKASTVDALREFAVKAAIGADHEFFNGKSSTATSSCSDRENILGLREHGGEDVDSPATHLEESAGELDPFDAAGLAPSSVATPAYQAFTKARMAEAQKIEKAIEEADKILADTTTEATKSKSEQTVRDAYSDCLTFRLKLTKLLMNTPETVAAPLAAVKLEPVEGPEGAVGVAVASAPSVRLRQKGSIESPLKDLMM